MKVPHALWKAHQANRLPHALLFAGSKGLEKVAETFARALLCQHPSAEATPCETCHACHWMSAKTHPDFIFLQPEAESQVIKIDAIRALSSFVHETSMQSGYRIVLIHPANAMNTQASNALLKTLEEPPAKTLFILVSEFYLRLPLTILSRCQKIMFSNDAPVEEEKEIMQKLDALYEKKEDPLLLAKSWQEIDLLHMLSVLLHWLREKLKRLPAKETMISLLQLSDDVQKRYVSVSASINLNKQLVLEDLLIRLSR